MVNIFDFDQVSKLISNTNGQECQVCEILILGPTDGLVVYSYQGESEELYGYNQFALKNSHIIFSSHKNNFEIIDECIEHYKTYYL